MKFYFIFLHPKGLFRRLDVSGMKLGFRKVQDLAEHSHNYIIHVTLSDAQKNLLERVFGLPAHNPRVKMPRKAKAILSRTKNIFKGKTKASKVTEISDSEDDSMSQSSTLLPLESTVENMQNGGFIALMQRTTPNVFPQTVDGRALKNFQMRKIVRISIIRAIQTLCRHSQQAPNTLPLSTH